MNQNTQEFVEKLKARADVLGVILFGSWARGNNRPNSDVDLIVILKDGYRRTVEYYNEQAFEIVYTTAESALNFWQSKKDDCANLWMVAKILYDKDGVVQDLKKKADEIILAGKKPIDEYQIEQFRFSAEDEIRAVEVLSENDLAQANFVLNYTVSSLISLFFDLRQLWIPAPKQRLGKIKELKPELYLVLESLYASDVSIKNKIESAKKIVELVFL